MSTAPASTREVAGTFLRLGLTAFGGPAAHVALFREELVRRQGWTDDAEFARLLAASNLIPGPTSTELAMHLGYRRAGWPGLLAAGLAFATPAVALVLAVAWGYATWGTLPAVTGVLAGIAPVVVAIIAHAALGLGRSVLRTPALVAVGVAAGLASLVAVPEPVILLAAAAAGLAAAATGPHLPGPVVSALIVSWPWGAPGGVAGALAAVAGWASGTGAVLPLFASFLKVGSILFGSGYLLVALLRDEFVVGLGWLSERQLLDAVAVGQFTPGPLFTTATFVGYLILGLPGAIAGTAGMALPAFALVALSIPVLERLRESRVARVTLEVVSAAVVGLLVAVSVALGRTAVVDALTLAMAVVAFVLLLRSAVGPAWLILAGAAIGGARSLLAGP